MTLDTSDVDFAFEELRARIGENFGHITVDYNVRLEGPEVGLKIFVHVMGDLRNIIGPAFGESLGEAIQHMNEIIDKEEELYTWPWWKIGGL